MWIYLYFFSFTLLIGAETLPAAGQNPPKLQSISATIPVVLYLLVCFKKSYRCLFVTVSQVKVSKFTKTAYPKTNELFTNYA